VAALEQAKKWRIVWLVCAFDLPVTDKAARQRYTVYRSMLLTEGFTMVQNSLYARHFPSLTDAKRAASRLGKTVPQNGKVDFYFITDQQMGITMSFFGPVRRTEEGYDVSPQGSLF
jgi:CRISPR-associated protein Cas2